MNEKDFAREMRRSRKERITRPLSPDELRRFELINKITATTDLTPEEAKELDQLQRKFGLPPYLD